MIRRWAGSPATNVAALIIGGLLVLMGVAGLPVGDLGFAWFGHPSVGWPIIRVGPSITLVLVGVALLAYVLRWLQTGIVCAMLALAMCAVALMGHARLLNASFAGMSMQSAVLLGTAAVALVVGSLASWRDWAIAVFGIAGTLLFCVAGSFLVARAIGVVDPITNLSTMGSSAQVVLASIMLALVYLALAITMAPQASFETTRWLPVAVGVASATAFVVLWEGMRTQANGQLSAMTRQAAETQTHAMVRDLNRFAQALRRGAEAHVQGIDEALEYRMLIALDRDMSSWDGVVWLPLADSARRVLVPAETDSAGVGLAWIRFRGMHPPMPDTVGIVPLDGGGRRFAVMAPGCANGTCLGAMAAIVHVGRLFAGTLSDTVRGFHFALVSDTTRITDAPPLRPADAPWLLRMPLPFQNVRLQLETWPTATTLRGNRSNISYLLLGVGLFISGVLPLTIHAMQRVRRSVSEREQARLARALDHATAGIWDIDLTTGESRRSPNLLHNLGYQSGDVPPTLDAWTALVHPVDRARFARSLDSHLDGSEPQFEIEYRVRAAHGRWHTIVERGRVVERDLARKPVRLLGISADVTEARSLEAARQASEARFRAVFESGFHCQLLVDANGGVLEINRAAIREGAARERDLLGECVWDVLWWSTDVAAGDRLRTACHEALTGSVVEYEDELVTETGGPQMLVIGVKRVDFGEGASRQLLVEVRDVTLRQRAEAVLNEADALTTMGRLAARVAHEINNPLAGIQSAFLLIRNAVPPTHPHFAYVGAIEREIARIGNVTRQLYETYRPEADDHAATSLQLLVHDAKILLEQVNSASGVRIAPVLENVPSTIPIPAAMLRQVLYNLLQNATEVSPPGGVIELHALVVDHMLELRVRDYGPGVPPALRSRIFDPFFTTKSGANSKSGMGLGLALVRRTVQAASGTIHLQHPTGGGAEFVVRFPLSSPMSGVLP